MNPIVIILQEQLDTPDGQFPATLQQAGVLDALEASLDSDSPPSVAIAVGTLHFIGKFPKDHKASKKADDAIRALVRMIEEEPPPPPTYLESVRTAFQRCAAQ